MLLRRSYRTVLVDEIDDVLFEFQALGLVYYKFLVAILKEPCPFKEGGVDSVLLQVALFCGDDK